MDWFDFEKSGYITKKPLCRSKRTVLDGNSNDELEYFGVSVAHKYSNGYFNYLLIHEIVVKGFIWKIDSLFGDNKEDSWTISIKFLREDDCDAYEKLHTFLFNFTSESVRKALTSSPHLADLLTNHYSFVKFCNKDISIGGVFMGLNFSIYHNNIGKYYSELTEKEDADILCEYAHTIRKELNSFSLDTSKLKKKPKEEPFLPDWLNKAIKIGGRIGLKVLCVNLGANIGGDLFGNSDGGDISSETDLYGVDDLDFSDGINFIDRSELDFSNEYVGTTNVSFYGNATPNFDTGRDVHIISESGTDKGYFDVFLQDGKKYIKFGTGSSSAWSNWVLIQGKQSFSWHGNRYIIK